VIGAEFLKEFQAAWIAMLRAAMAKTGKGYRRPSGRRTGKPEYNELDRMLMPADRRYDKTLVQNADPARFEKRLTRGEQQARSCAKEMKNAV
jgi:hypothetical protein